MHLALPPQHHLAHVLAMGEGNRGVLLDDLGDGCSEFNLVLLLLGGDSEAEHPLGNRATLNLELAAFLLRKGVADLDAVEPTERDGVAGLGFTALHGLLAHQGKDARDPLIVSSAIQGRAIGEGSGENASERELTAVCGMEGFGYERA